MLSLKVADWPNMKEAARKKYFDLLNKTSNPVILKIEKKPITTADLAVLLNKG